MSLNDSLSEDDRAKLAVWVRLNILKSYLIGYLFDYHLNIKRTIQFQIVIQRYQLRCLKVTNQVSLS